MGDLAKGRDAISMKKTFIDKLEEVEVISGPTVPTGQSPAPATDDAQQPQSTRSVGMKGTVIYDAETLDHVESGSSVGGP